MRSERPVGEGESLGKLLEGVLANLNLGERLSEQLAQTAWPEIAGRLVAAHSWAEAIRDGVLIVGCDSPAWAQELHMRKHELLGRLAAHLGAGVVRDLRFRTGTRSRRAPRSQPAIPPPASVELSAEEVEEARRAAARIEDPALRARAERAFLALARMSRWRRETGWRRCERCGQWQRTGRRWCGSCLHRSRAPE